MTRLLLILLLPVLAYGQNFKPMMGIPINIAHPLSDFVAAWFLLEGSGNIVIDLSGNNRTGTLIASPPWGPGKFGSCITGNGTNQYVSFGTDKIVDHDITVVMWVYLTQDTNSMGLFAKRTSVWSADTVAYMFEWDTIGNTWRWITHGDINIFSAATSVPLNRWIQLVLTQDSTTAYLYLDGVLWDTTDDIVFAAGNKEGIDNLIFASSAGTNETEGKLDHCIVYNRYFTASEIALLYRESFCMFEQEDIALMALEEAPAPGGEQVIIIQMTVLPVLFILIYMRQKHGHKII